MRGEEILLLFTLASMIAFLIAAIALLLVTRNH